MKCQCDNCGHAADYNKLPAARDLFVRLEVGGTFTDVECPKCGCLCFPTKEKKAKAPKAPNPTLSSKAQRKFTLGYPVRIELFYEDYDPFGNEDKRSYSQIYFYESHEEAKKAQKSFKESAEKLGVIDTFEAHVEYLDGVAYRGRFHRLRDTQDLLQEQIAEKEESI